MRNNINRWVVYGNDVYAIYGMSIAGVLAANIWQNKKINIQKLIFDGSPLVLYPKILKSYLTNFYLVVTHKSQQRDKKTVNQASNTIISDKHLEEFLKVLDNMSDENIINYMNEWGSYKLLNNINAPNTEIYYYHGTKMNEMLTKKSKKYKKNYPNSNIICFEGKGHYETSLMNQKEMIKELDKVLIKNNK